MEDGERERREKRKAKRKGKRWRRHPFLLYPPLSLSPPLPFSISLSFSPSQSLFLPPLFANTGNTPTHQRVCVCLLAQLWLPTTLRRPVVSPVQPRLFFLRHPLLSRSLLFPINNFSIFLFRELFTHLSLIKRRRAFRSVSAYPGWTQCTRSPVCINSARSREAPLV